MKRFVLTLALFILSTTLLSAQQRTPLSCASHEAFTKHLDKTYKEVIVGFGKAVDNKIVELFVNLEDRNWSMLVVLTNGNACMFLSGDSWEFIKLPKKDSIDFGGPSNG